MKKNILFVSLLLIFIFSKLPSQTISYILPDIGSPGMNTYVEFIGPYNLNGNFGSDTLYANNPGDFVRIEPVNPADSDKIAIGPVVVSWNGKMASAQIFVHPWVSPNSANWMNLNNNFKIAIRVKVGANYSNADTFFIVQPYNFGDQSSNAERMLGDGTLGFRSKRGAMLVNSMKLANAYYGVSPKDCDPYTDGNQGYLPFVLISKAKIEAGSSGTITIDGATPNAGPGGGGGGGKFCDGSLINPLVGDDGGNGYTGGGHGGRNGSGVSNLFKAVGTGTGSSGASLNGVSPGSADWYESSGGGTGFPFGTSGIGCNSGPFCDPDGQYGAGSGYRDDQNGGAAGFGSAGLSSSTKNGGKITGNPILVPLAGGSGGASGNPHSIHQCSGNGGGGGGGIRIAALRIENINVSANGGAPGNSSYGVAIGGAGSGGGIDFESRIGASNNVLSASGVSGGGGGRIKIESPDTSNITTTYNNGGGSLFYGLTTDTLQYVKRKFNIRISANKQNQIVYSFIKSLHGQWIPGNAAVVPQTANNVYLPVDLPVGDSIYYFVVYQKVLTPSVAAYNSDPFYFMSQSAANIFKLDVSPKIAGDSVANMKLMACEGSTVNDSLKLYNLGDGNMTVNFNKAYFARSTPGLKLDFPTAAKTILPLDSVYFRISYTYNSPAKGVIYDTLMIPHNDTKAYHNPWQVFIKISFDTVQLLALHLNLKSRIDTLDFGKVCLGNSKEINFALKNLSTAAVTLLKPDFTSNNSFFAWISGKIFLPQFKTVNDTSTIGVIFTPQGLGTYESRLILKVGECQDYADTLVVIGEGVTASLRFESVLTFSDVTVGRKDTGEVNLVNDGDGDVLIDNVNNLVPPFKVVSTEPPVPVLLKSKDTIKVFVEYSPTQEKLDSAWMKAISKKQADACSDSASVLVIGKGTRAQALISLDSVDLGIFAYCQVSKDTSIILKNGGTGTFNVLAEPTITGKDSSMFLIAQNFSSYSFPPGRSDTIWVKFVGEKGKDGPKEAFVYIKTDDPVNKDIYVKVKAFQEGLDITINPPSFDFGNVPVGKPNQNKVFVLTNNGTIRRHLNGIQSSNPDFTPNPVVADLTGGGGTANITVNFLPSAIGPENATLTFIYDTPCRDTQYVAVKGTGLEGTVSFQDSIFFGTLAPCEDILDSVSYTNTGQAGVQVDTMYIQGTDAALFSLVNPVTFPFIIDTSGVFTQKLRFKPLNTTNGLKYAELVIKVFMNGQNKTFKTKLTGIRIVPFLPDQNSMNFGNAVINSTSQLPLRISNTGVRPFTILTVKGNYIGSEYNMTPLPLNIPVPPGGFQDFQIYFTPKLEKFYNDTLRFVVQYNGCIDTGKVELKGAGIPPRGVILYLPVDTVMPNIENYSLPVFANLDKAGDTVSGIVLTADIQWNYTLFYPKSVMNGKIISNTLSNGIRTFRIQSDTLTLTSAKTKIMAINGTTMLGNSDSTDLTWKAIAWSNPTLIGKTDTVNGSLHTIICRNGGNRLVKQTNPLMMTVSPNPAGDGINVSGTVIERGMHSIELINIQGQSITLRKWDVSGENDSTFDYSINLSEISSGVYYLLLRSPERSQIEKLYIVK